MFQNIQGCSMFLDLSTAPFFISVSTNAFHSTNLLCCFSQCYVPTSSVARYLALINRAGGLYGRILTDVVSTDLTAFGLYTRPRSRFSHTDRLSSVNKMFIMWQTQEQFNLFHVTG